MSNILLIDSYDSFTFNLSTLIENVTGATVITIRNDSVNSNQLINEILPLFDAVIVGPGPGSPDNPSDIGVLPDLWNLSDEKLIPVFGVCLGFQSMVLGFGGTIHRLKVVKHGQPGKIHHSGNSIFKGIAQDFPSIRYHSLHAKMGSNDLIEPLAWLVATEDDHEEDVLMAGKHKTSPFYGVQYHPESICSENGAEVLKNFWKLAKEWSKENNRIVIRNEEKLKDFKSHYSIKPDPLYKYELKVENPAIVRFEKLHLKSLDSSTSNSFISPTIICDEILNSEDFVLLNSASEPGRWSIIGVLQPGKSTVITHYTSKSPDYAYISKWKEDSKTIIDLRSEGLNIKQSNGVANGNVNNNTNGKCNGNNIHTNGKSHSHSSYPSIWNFLAQYMGPKILKYKSSITPPNAPFIGGLVGYFSYEASSLHMIPEKKPLPVAEENQTNAADVSLVDIERTILIDNKNHILYTVSLLDNDDEWLLSTIQRIDQLQNNPIAPPDLKDLPSNPTITMPDKSKYISKIKSSQEFLKSGDSYELCLTAQTKIQYSESIDAWNLYKILLKRNPAPYSCFLDLPDSILVGSSPERFMSWNKDGMCEFRPIKGTVKKSPEMTREKAEAILNTPKELGENLMIVDLIRHDLNQILHNVRADKLMSVEEYKTVYQLVSVIQGDLPKEYLGIDVLSHSLPPGSMTGAPKLRSVEILHNLEDQIPRGIYSGVSGYWSVQDEGDWSVIIRSAYLYKHDPHTWRIGAGGAITILSDPEDEWEEMKTKLQTALQAFIS